MRTNAKTLMSYRSPYMPRASHQSNKIFGMVFFSFKKLSHSRPIKTIHMMQLEHMELIKYLCFNSELLNKYSRYNFSFNE